MNKIAVLINNEIAFEFDRDISLQDRQLAFLDRMDADMDNGIRIHGERITNPDARQRASFVVMNLIKALQQDNEAVITASCAYLANRRPKLIEVHADDHDDSIKIEFVDEG